MRRLLSSSFACVLLVAVALPGGARAAVPHTVQPGETLWSIAAASNLTTRTVAAFNGLPETAQVVVGQTVMIPSTVEGYAALQKAGLVPPGPGGAAPAAAPATSAATAASAAATAPPAATASSAAASPPSGAPPALGGYKVRRGDTLSALAARSGVSVGAMAAMNGLDPDGVLLEGTLLKLPTGAPEPVRADRPVPARTVVPAAAPAPTESRVDAGTIASIAAEHGVPSSLATAIAWQESGFNNDVVSSANARGVMQVMPGTWDFVQQNLTSQRLDPASARDNVHAGVLYLRRLLQSTGGDETAAAAGYYQGLASVRRIGMLPETQRYVANVRALRGRFTSP